MKRITMHLSGVKQVTTEVKKQNQNGGFDYIKKKICYNTIAREFDTESECLSYMSQYINDNKNHVVTKYYLSNVR